MLVPEKISMVIYHKDCPDGFGAAFGVWLLRGEKAQYHPAIHGNIPPDVIGQHVLIADFSYPAEILTEMIRKASSLLVIDHHITAQKELAAISDQYKIFDMMHSGAYLVWRYLYPAGDVPLFIKYIEDRDLWSKKLPYNEEFSAGLAQYPFNFEVWKTLLTDFSQNTEALLHLKLRKTEPINRGFIVLAADRSNMNNLLRNAACRDVSINNKVYHVALLNSQLYRSDLGNQLLSQFPQADFSCVYTYSDAENSTHVSLRSENSRADVSEIAKLYGGGGHRNASGMTFKYIGNIIQLLTYSPSLPCPVSVHQN